MTTVGEKAPSIEPPFALDRFLIERSRLPRFFAKLLIAASPRNLLPSVTALFAAVAMAAFIQGVLYISIMETEAYRPYRLQHFLDQATSLITPSLIFFALLKPTLYFSGYKFLMALLPKTAENLAFRFLLGAYRRIEACIEIGITFYPLILAALIARASGLF